MRIVGFSTLNVQGLKHSVSMEVVNKTTQIRSRVSRSQDDRLIRMWDGQCLRQFRDEDLNKAGGVVET
jgi:hypothetical protein